MLTSEKPSAGTHVTLSLERMELENYISLISSLFPLVLLIG
jgi:hypothetical protein